MTSKTWTILLVPALLLCAVAPPVTAADRAHGGGVLAQQRGRGPQGRGAEGRGLPRAEPFRPGPRGARPVRPQDRRGSYEEPAFARGYADGFMLGTDDGRNRDRYDPVGHRDYRSGEQGYYRDYGSRDAYRNNYRAGFRQGYDAGYRDGSRGPRQQ